MQEAQETLKIQIKYDDGGASTALEELEAHVRALNDATRSGGFSRLGTAAGQLRSLAKAAASVSNVSASFRQVANSANRLFASFQSAPNYAAGIKNMSGALDAVGGKLKDFSDSARGITPAVSGLATLSSTLKNFSGGNTANATTMIQELSDQLRGIDKTAFSAVDKLASGLSKLSKLGKTGVNLGNLDIGGISSVINDLSSRLAGINVKQFSAVEHIADGLRKLNNLSGVQNLKANLQNVAQEAANFAQALVNAIPDDVLNKFTSFASALATINSSMRRVGNGAASISVGMRDTSGSLNMAEIYGRALKDTISQLWGAFKALTKVAAKFIGLSVGMAFKGIVAPAKAAANAIGDMFKRFGNFISAVGRIAIYRGIRTGLKLVTQTAKEGINNLYVWSEQVGNRFEQTMDSFATSFMYLKNSIGAAVSPLLDALAPAVEIVINQLVDFINVLNQVIATLTGATSWRKAIRSAADYSDNIGNLGHQAEEAQDAVKELKKTVMGFDEFNILDPKEKTTEKAKNGKDATGIYGQKGALSFMEMPVNKDIADWVNKWKDKLKEAWDKADFFDIGEALANKLADLLYSIPWEEKIKPFIVKLAKSLGTFLNGLLDYETSAGARRLWDAIAYTIYNAINTALLGYTTFFDTVNWRGIGQGIGYAVKRTLEGIDWDMLAGALAAFPNAVIDLINGFCLQMTARDFYTASQHIGQTISQAIVNIHWNTFFKDLVGVADRILNAINGALENFDWSGVKDGIIKGIQRIPKFTWYNLGTDLGKLIVNAADFAANVVDLIVKAFESGEWGMLIDGIKNGINKRVQELYGGWDGLRKHLGDWLKEHSGIIKVGLNLALGLLTWNTAKLACQTMLKTAIANGAGFKLAAFLTDVIALGVAVNLSIHTIKSILAQNFNGMTLKSSLKFAIQKGLMGALAGGLVAFAIGGFGKNVLFGATIGFGVTLGIITIKSILDSSFKDLTLKSSIKLVTQKALMGALSGALIGFGIAGVAGALFGMTIGAALTLGITLLKADFDKHGNVASLVKDLSGGIAAGALAAGLLLKAGAATGALLSGTALAFTVGVALTLMLEEIIGGVASQIDSNLDAWGVNPSEKGINMTEDDIQKLYAGLPGLVGFGSGFMYNSYNTASGSSKGFGIPFKLIPDLSDAPNWISALEQAWTGEEQRHGKLKFKLEPLNESTTWVEAVFTFWQFATLTAKAAPFRIQGVVNESREWWTQAMTFWNAVTAVAKASRFRIQGVVNDAREWWTQANHFWSEVVNGNAKAHRFHVQGVVNDAREWWTQTNNFWTNVVSGGSKAHRFHVQGVVNEAQEWWRQAKTFWEGAVNGVSKAARFHVQGVVNDSAEWWRQAKSFWEDRVNNTDNGLKLYVSDVFDASKLWWYHAQQYWYEIALNNTLKAQVEIVNTWNSFARAWNEMQSYFNSHPLQATVNTNTATATANGGVYVNGNWQPVTMAAMGGLFGTGQMFIAREAGPELVGSIGGNTAVMNNDQIVASVADGVARAVAAVLANGNDQPVNIYIGGEKIDQYMVKRNRRNNLMSGGR